MNKELDAAVERLKQYSSPDFMTDYDGIAGVDIPDIRLILAELERRGRVIERDRSALRLMATSSQYQPGEYGYQFIMLAKEALAYDGTETEEK